MSTVSGVNMRSPKVRRVLAEIKELSKTCGLDKEFYAIPLPQDMFEIHFTIRGPPDTPFSEGLYHGKLVLPAEYPLKPPEIYFLTPNGRFQEHQKICLSVSDYHPEEWKASWNINSILVAIAAFLPSPTQGAIGAVNFTDSQRRVLAKQSQHYVCPECHTDHSQFLSNKEFYANLLGSKKDGDSSSDGSAADESDKKEQFAITFTEQPHVTPADEIAQPEATPEDDKPPESPANVENEEKKVVKKRRKKRVHSSSPSSASTNPQPTPTSQGSFAQLQQTPPSLLVLLLLLFILSIVWVIRRV